MTSDSPFITDIVRNALKTRTVRIPEKLAIFGASVTYLEEIQKNILGGCECRGIT